MASRFPFRTFDEIAELGLEVMIYCQQCYRTVGPIDLRDERLHGRTFWSVRFVCGQARRIYDAHPARICGCLGHLSIRPAAGDFIPPHRSVPWCSISCPRCLPPWEVSQAARHLPPWKGIWTAPDTRLSCPSCRSVLTTSWHGGAGIPYTDGFKRQAAAR